MDELTSAQLPLAADQMISVFSTKDCAALRQLIDRWMELDPNAAAAWVFRQPAGEVRKLAAEQILPVWAKADPGSAVEWFKSLTGQRPRSIGPDSEWNDLAQPLIDFDIRSPLEIIAELRTLAPEDFKPRSYHTKHSRLCEEWQASTLGLNQWQPAMEQLQTLTTTESGPIADWAENEKPFLLRAWLPQDPRAEMKWLEKHPHSTWGDGFVEESLVRLMQGTKGSFESQPTQATRSTWPTQDEIAQWFLKIPRLSKTTSSIESLVERWSHVDLNGAGSFVNQQPPGPETDAARAIIALKAVEVEPESALTWTAAITDETLRQKTEQQVQEKWLKLDPTKNSELNPN